MNYYLSINKLSSMHRYCMMQCLFMYFFVSRKLNKFLTSEREAHLPVLPAGPPEHDGRPQSRQTSPPSETADWSVEKGRLLLRDIHYTMPP
jgi:hypothetical protein